MILIFQDFEVRVYVTKASTAPGIPVDMSGSCMEKVIELELTLVTLKVRNPHPLGPEWRVLGPSFCGVL